MSAIKDWFFTPAHWWEFWMPQSGLLGGSIAGVLIACVLVVIE